MDDYERFLNDLKNKLGLDLSGYKRKQMERRISSLMKYLELENSYEKLIKILLRDEDIYHSFLDRITINVSEFFRNPVQWEILRKKMMPLLLSPDKRLYIWSAGCASGEEPYSLAMSLMGVFPWQKYVLWATDCDQVVLEKAKQGVYPPNSVQNIPEIFLKQFFVFKNEEYFVKPELKRSVLFEKHDLLKDEFPKQMDLIVCRNVVIYFKEEIKDELYLKFYKALRPGGILFVGCTEQIIQARKIGFESISPFFYRRSL